MELFSLLRYMHNVTWHIAHMHIKLTLLLKTAAGSATRINIFPTSALMFKFSTSHYPKPRQILYEIPKTKHSSHDASSPKLLTQFYPQTSQIPQQKKHQEIICKFISVVYNCFYESNLCNSFSAKGKFVP